MKNRFPYFLFLMLLPNLTEAQTQKLTPELLWQVGRVGLECTSADGQLAVYGVQRFDIQANTSTRVLYVVNIQTGQTRQISDPTKSAEGAEFRPDGQKIGFLMGGKLHETDREGQGLKQISEIEMNGFHYAPNGKMILFTQNVKQDKTAAELYPDLPKTSGRIIDGLFYRHWKSWHDYSYSNIFYTEYYEGGVSANVKNIMNEPFDSPLQPMGGMEQITWSPDSRFIVYASRKLRGTEAAQSTNSDIYVYDLAAGKTANVTEGMPGYDLDPIFSPDGKYLAWTSMERPGNEADRTRLMVLEVATSFRQELTTGWDFEANHPQWAADSRSLYFLSSTDFTYHIFNIGLNDKKINRITSGQHDYNGLKVAGNQLIASRVSMADPPEIFAVNPSDGQARRLSFSTEIPWAGIAKGKVERRSLRATDGKNLNVWVIYPPDFDASKKYPALLMCQGGPQSALSQYFSFRWNYQLMAAKGYVVIAPCRRGMPGSGQKWNDEISRDWGGQAMRDLLTATDVIGNEPFIDKNRMGAVGASYGGYSVYWLAGNHQKRFKAFVSHCGIFNFESFFGTTEELWFVKNDLGEGYWQKPLPETWTRDNPIRYVENWDTPMLVIHNELDLRVPLSEGMQAFQAAQLRGIPSKFLYFPDEGHWMSKAQNSILWQRVFFEWLDEYLK